MAKNKLQNARLRSECPIACLLDIVGDRWTLLIVRDIFKGKKRYKDFASTAERIPTNILAARLRMLEDEKIVTKALYNEHPPRFEYELTNKGLELGKILEAMYHWGNKNILNRKS